MSDTQQILFDLADEISRMHPKASKDGIVAYVKTRAGQLSAPTPPVDKPEGEWVKCSEMDDELRWILGRPNFACVGIAERLRELGQDIERKAESEQAAAIHWMMSLYVQYGTDWLKKGNALLEARPAAPDMGGEK